jgi:hypothetical protein
MPPNATKVDRSTKWGNPFKVGEKARHPITGKWVLIETREQAIDLFALFMKSSSATELASEARKELRGKNLACWCAAGASCHADVLIRLANVA